MKNSLLYLVVLVLAFFIISASSCHKEDPEPDLVPITTTGANTMGFYVDGKKYNFKGKIEGMQARGVNGGINSSKILRIFGAGGESIISLQLFIPLDSVNSNGEYILRRNIDDFDVVSFIDNSPLGGLIFNCDSLHTGKIVLLKSDNVAAGTFYFDAINYETGKVIHVTDGRFDIQLF